jgi:hypothetical protein
MRIPVSRGSGAVSGVPVKLPSQPVIAPNTATTQDPAIFAEVSRARAVEDQLKSQIDSTTEALSAHIQSVPEGGTIEVVINGEVHTITRLVLPEGSSINGTIATVPAAGGGGGSGTLSFLGQTLTTQEDSAIHTNLLTGITSINGTVTVLQFSVTIGLNTTIYGAGLLATIDGVGTVQVQANGSFDYVPVANWNGTFSGVRVLVTDGTDVKLGTITINVAAVNDAPIAVDDGGATPVDTPIVIHPLANDYDIEGSTLTLTHINAATFTPETPISIDHATLVPHADGTVTVQPETSYSGIIAFSYTVSDGELSSTATAIVLVSNGSESGPTAILPDPVTVPRLGTRTWHIGPNPTSYPPVNSYTFHGSNLADVPWNQLQAGDVVNVYYRATPYFEKPVIAGQGTQALPIVLWGVTDEFGRRPIIDGTDAVTLQSTTGIISTEPLYGTDLGLVIVHPRTNFGSLKPTWIEVKNLHIRNCGNALHYYSMAGVYRSWSGAACGLYLWGDDIDVFNCVFDTCAQGVFTVSRLDDVDQITYRVKMRSSRFINNGHIGSMFEHNYYCQVGNPITEGCYFSHLRAGSQGSTFKTRASGEVTRYNYFVGTARCHDMVEAQESLPITNAADYGKDVSYGNIYVIDHTIDSIVGPTHPLHYGGDHGEVDYSGSVPIPDAPVRTSLMFFSNTVYIRTLASDWHTAFMQLSMPYCTAYLWDNMIVLAGAENVVMSLVELAGRLELHGTNYIAWRGSQAADATAGALPTNYSIQRLGTLLDTAPDLNDVNNRDHRLATGSPAIGAGSGGTLPATLPADIIARATPHPVLFQPYILSNGLVTRATTNDLGALEYGVGGGPPPVPPVNTVAPVVSATIQQVTQQATTTTGTWTQTPTAYHYQWQYSATGSSWADITGATNSTYTFEAVGYVRCGVVAENVAGLSDIAYSSGVQVTALGSPIFTLQPISVSIQEGASGEFTATVTGTPTPTAQWQYYPVGGSAWSDITSATNWTYTTGAAAFSNSGDQYRVVATNTNGSLASSAATLTVVPIAEPDSNGVFNFVAPDGTLLSAINSGFTRLDGNTPVQIEVSSNQIVYSPNTQYVGNVHMFATGHASTDQYIAIRIAASASTGEIKLFICTEPLTMGYIAIISASAVTLYKGGAWQGNAAHGINLTTTSAVFALNRQAGTIIVTCNGATVITFNDSTPLTTAGEGFNITGSDAVSPRIESMTFTRGATL